MLAYPYSIQPSGLHGNLGHAQLRHAQAAYVNYRYAGETYWTSRPVNLSAHEDVYMLDGTLLRGRCGNTISRNPAGPTLPLAVERNIIPAMEEPIPDEHEEFVSRLPALFAALPEPGLADVPHVLAGSAAGAAPGGASGHLVGVALAGGSGVLGARDLGAMGSPTVPVVGVAAVVTPEPSTLSGLLLGLALFGGIWAGRYRRKA